MPETEFRNRRAVAIQNQDLRVTVLVEGGHVAEICDLRTGVNPLWIPVWPSVEPSTYGLAKHPEYGADSESKLLAGIMGHNLCLDIFGGPSEAEAAAGLTVHGEASVAPYDIRASGTELWARADLPMAGLRIERRIRLNGRRVLFAETVENLSAYDRPIAWTQHVTLGPPFLEKGATQFRVSATRSKVFDVDFSDGQGYMQIGAEFEWPHVPSNHGGTVDLQVFTNTPVSAGFTTHLMDRRATPTSWHSHPVRRCCSGTSGSRRTSLGSVFGKRITAGRMRLGVARALRAAWSSAYPRCRRRGAR